MSTKEEAKADATGEHQPTSDLEEGLEHLGRAVTGVMTRLLGERVTGQPLDPERPVLSEQADATLDQLGDKLGRWLNASGGALKAHPTRPGKALDEAVRHRAEAVETREGETALTAGLRSLVGGLGHSTEAVLDKVAPRRTRPPAGEE